jgi:catechol 2,3-dioxygenase-like lactoylglutathione lyase family enzyme
MAAAAGLIGETAAFYGQRLGLELVRVDERHIEVRVGESVLVFRAFPGSPFYHVALLVPGDRFDAALDWARERVELLSDPETGEAVFDFVAWEASACYFHDPSGSIVELIAHRGLGEAGTTGPFEPGELVGVSEVGIVCDPPPCAEALERELGLGVWDGTVVGAGRLAFVGERTRTLILCRAGRPWLPTGRPAEAHPMEVMLAGTREGEVPLRAGGQVQGRR